MRVFISYSHRQGDWVCERLVPCLEAGGAEVLIDRERFRIGKAVVGQMDATQDKAHRHLLILSPDYLASPYCQHEMKRALKLDPKFDKTVVLPVVRAACSLPKAFTGWNPPIYAQLEDDKKPEPWNALLRECGANKLGTSAPEWLEARDDIIRLLQRGQSVNLVANGKANWKGLIEHISRDYFPDLAKVDLYDPETMTRQGLLSAICKALGERTALRDEPHDLSDFKTVLQNRSNSRVALTHFDLAPDKAGYDANFFAALRYLNMDMRKLTLLIQSHTAFGTLLPKNHPLSDMNIATVELRGE